MHKERTASALVVPVLMLVFAIVYGWSNRSVPASDMRFAMPVTLLLAVLSLVLIVSIMRKRVPVGPALTAARLKRPVMLLVCSAVLLFGAAWDFMLATAAFLAIAIPALGVRRVAVVVPTAIGLPIALYFGFSMLGVPLNSIWFGG
ncbi:hypothetical protein [Salinisphaera sp. T31B1]|uniref:hypothetical protein n=1 Tax=Salinisphaera sp. T31B1 TaxID=727963 RepID=UPI00333E5AF3